MNKKVLRNPDYWLWYRRYLLLAVRSAVRYRSFASAAYILKNLHDLASYRAQAANDKRPEKRSHFTYTMY